jgi:hypothetical protein
MYGNGQEGTAQKILSGLAPELEGAVHYQAAADHSAAGIGVGSNNCILRMSSERGRCPSVRFV